jgi:hypothetical protein
MERSNVSVRAHLQPQNNLIVFQNKVDRDAKILLTRLPPEFKLIEMNERSEDSSVVKYSEFGKGTETYDR